MKNAHRSLTALFFLACLFLFLASPSIACITTWTDDWTPADDDLSSPLLFGSSYFHPGSYQSYGYTHDIRDDGFEPGVDIIYNYRLSIDLRDDSGCFWDWIEVAYINLPGWWSDALVEIDYESIELGISLAGLASLNNSGTLDVTITQIFGDFYFYGSSFVACGVDNSTLPAPGSILLVTTSLLALTCFRRRLWQR